MQLNKVINRYVAYNKQIERRMEGSSGGAVAAILETLAREDYYFCGATYDDNLHVRHLITNDPQDISRITGFKPIASDLTGINKEIETVLSNGAKVVFIGTPVQCYELKKTLPINNNLICIDIICTPFVISQLYERYILDLEEEFGSKVTAIRFYNKEFAYENSKRITFKSGNTIFTYKEDAYDRLVCSGKYFQADENAHDFISLSERVGDITIGSYSPVSNDGMGYAYISSNTEKGDAVVAKSKKRLIICEEGESIELKRIKYNKSVCTSMPNECSTFNGPLSKFSPERKIGGKFSALLYTIKPFILGLMSAHYNPLAFCKFVKLNYFTKGVQTDKYHNGFVFISPNCALKLVDGFVLELHGPLNIGPRRIKSSKQETRLRMEKGAKIIVHNQCSFGAGSNVEIYKNATLEVGNLGSNAELTIICGEYIKLGDTCNVARNATIRDTSGHVVAIPGFKMTRPVIIGNHTWICSEATIMPGVKVGDGAIVGSCSYVARNVAPFTLVQGTPAQEVGQPNYFRI